MKPEIKAKWLAALRSGEYKKGTGRLCRLDEQGNKTFCCLGVLCDLFQKDTNQGAWTPNLVCSSKLMFQLPEHIGDYYLPKPVMEWAGLSVDNILIPAGSVRGCDVHISSINDDEHGVKSFAEIADILEQQENLNLKADWREKTAAV